MCDWILQIDRCLRWLQLSLCCSFTRHCWGDQAFLSIPSWNSIVIGDTDVTCNHNRTIWENIRKVTSKGLFFFQDAGCGPLVLRPLDGVESPKAELPVVCLGRSDKDRLLPTWKTVRHEILGIVITKHRSGRRAFSSIIPLYQLTEHCWRDINLWKECQADAMMP